MTKRKKSINNIIFAIVGHIVTIAIGLILPRIFIKEYGSHINGFINTINQLLVYLSLFEAGIGATSLQSLYKPIAEHNKEMVSSILTATKLFYKRAAFGYLICLLFISFIFPLLIDTGFNYFSSIIIILFSGLGSVFSFQLIGHCKVLINCDGNNYILTNISSATVLINALLKIIFIYQKISLPIIIVISFLIQLLQVFIIYIYSKSHYRNELNYTKPDWTALSQKNDMLIHQISGLIFNNTDMLILSVFCGLKIVSVYSIYKLVITHIESILSSFINGISFVLGQLLNTNINEYAKRIDIVESYYSALAFSLFSVAYYLFIPFLNLYVDNIADINYSDKILVILFISIALLTATRTPMLLTINYAGHFKKTTPQTITESVINIVVSLIGVNFLGIYGVLIGTIVALLYRTNDIIIYANKKILYRKPYITYKIYAINILLFFVTQYILNWLFSDITNISSFILIGFCSTIISMTIFALVHTIIFSHCRLYIKKILGR